MPKSFCVFILSHGRPARVTTLDTIARGGYSGPWFLVVDNEDATRDEYVRRYGRGRVIVFDKAAIAQTFDSADLSRDRRTVVYARNACFEIARTLGYRYFLQLDDDYYDVQHRYEAGDRLTWVYPNNLDRVCDAMLDFLDASGAASVAFAQGGDFIGGKDGGRWKQKIFRKAMNSFFCRTDASWRFLGRINEDVNTYTTLAQRGFLFFTTAYLNINQTDTQQQSGGMTSAYLDGGTYVKSFYPVMMCPSAVRVVALRADHARIHHQVDWNACAPKIINERYRRAGVVAHD